MMQEFKLQKESQPEAENNNQNLDNPVIDDQKDFHPNTAGLFEDIELYATSFVCLLAPRFAEHILVGDLSENLQTWMKDVCISFGWNLKFIEITPNYLHWIMTVQINSSPLEFMNIVRRTTSKKIFDEFPRFLDKNMSKEFWASYYFVGVGEAPYSRSAIKSFIEQIRMQQGL